MNRWSWHRTRVLLLALLLGVAMGLSFVQGSVMAVAMAATANGAHHGPSDCDGCGGGDHKDMKDAACLTVCASAAQGLMSGELLTLPSTSRIGFQLVHLLLSGQIVNPDHGPPKILILG
jgi:hypothetical protein